MSATVESFNQLVQLEGAPVLYHREKDAVQCPCVTPEGFRDPLWHEHLKNAINASAIFNTPSAPHIVDIIVSAVFGSVELAPVSIIYSNEAFGGLTVTVNVDWTIFDTAPDQINIYRSDDGGPYFLLGRLLVGQNTFTDSTPIGSLIGTEYAANSLPVTCNSRGEIPVITELTFYGFVQPAFATGNRNRGQAEFAAQVFGAIRQDDRIGIFPASVGTTVLDFTNWSNSGNEFIQFNGLKYNIVNWSAVPAPDDATAIHHYEVGLRRIGD